MITLFAIGVLIFTVKMIGLAFKATWGILKAMFFVAAIPLMLVGLLFSGIVALAVPLLIIALIGAFVIPAVKKM